MITNRLKLAILDLYDKEKNQGMRAIKEIVESYKHEVDYEVFDVRANCELPGTDFDIYISSGGPGDPLEGDGIWDKAYYELIEKLWVYNKSGQGTKKHVFFICHSFQMACHHFDVGKVCERQPRSFGTFPVYMTNSGRNEVFFKTLGNPFWVADFRRFQVVAPKAERLKELGAEVLCVEKPHIDSNQERAIMAIRFSNEFFGTQFHPEADPKGMIYHFSKADEKEEVIENFGLDKYLQMIQDLRDDDKIPATHNAILPSFMNNAIKLLKESFVV